MNVKKLTTMAMLVAVSIVLVWIGRFIPFFSMAFLEYDPADIPILIGAFAFGPVAGLMITVVASLVQTLTVSQTSGVYGLIMHIIATGTYVLVAGNIYTKKKTRGRAVIALVSGTLAMTVVMIGANLVVTPMFMGMPASAIVDYLIPVIIPFNLLKAGINGLVTFVLYKPLSRVIHNFEEHGSKQKVGEAR